MEIEKAKKIYEYMWQSGMMMVFAVLVAGIALIANGMIMMGVLILICDIAGFVKYTDCLPDNEYGNAPAALAENPEIEFKAYKIIKNWAIALLAMVIVSAPVEVFIFYLNK